MTKLAARNTCTSRLLCVIYNWIKHKLHLWFDTPTGMCIKIIRHVCPSVCLSAWKNSFPSRTILWYFIVINLLKFCRENWNWVIIGKKISTTLCTIILLILGETLLSKNIARIFTQNRTIASKVLWLHGVRMERFSPVRARPRIPLRFICTSIRQETIMSPLKWNILRLFQHHN